MIHQDDPGKSPHLKCLTKLHLRICKDSCPPIYFLFLLKKFFLPWKETSTSSSDWDLANLETIIWATTGRQSRERPFQVGHPAKERQGSKKKVQNFRNRRESEWPGQVRAQALWLEAG